MMVNISFLFGAGISKPSGLPLAKDLLDDIFGNKNGALDERLIEVMKHVKDSLGTDNYEDIYSVLKSLRLYYDGIYKNPAAVPYLEELKKYIDKMHSYGITDTCNMLCNYIDKVVCEKLQVPAKNIRGLDLLEQISKVKHINIDIFTLNHDTILETVLTDSVSDGFENFEDGLYIFSNKWDKKIRLHKLHGSIDWRPLYSREQKKYIPGKFDLSKGDTYIEKSCEKHGYKYEKDYTKILTGTKIKEFEYNFGIYADLFNLFFSRLIESNILFVSGYGWNDSAINLRILDWLQRSTENKLVLLHNEQKDPIPYFANKTFTQAAWGENKIEFINKWLSDTSIDDIKRFFQ